MHLSYCGFGRKLIFRFGGKGLGEENDVRGENDEVNGYMIREIRIQRGENECPGECRKARARSELTRIDWSADHAGTG